MHSVEAKDEVTDDAVNCLNYELCQFVVCRVRERRNEVEELKSWNSKDAGHLLFYTFKVIFC